MELREEIAKVLTTMGLRLSEEKTLITHIDEGLDFLGWRIQRHRKRGPTGITSTPTPPRRRWPPSWRRSRCCVGRSARTSRSTLCSAGSTRRAGLVRLFPGRGVLGDLLLPTPLPVADGMGMAAPQTPRIRPGRRSAAATATADGGQPPRTGHCSTPARSPFTRYRYRGTKIPTPWPTPDEPITRPPVGLVESPVPGNRHAGFGKRSGETARSKDRNRASGRLSPIVRPTPLAVGGSGCAGVLIDQVRDVAGPFVTGEPSAGQCAGAFGEVVPDICETAGAPQDHGVVAAGGGEGVPVWAGNTP